MDPHFVFPPPGTPTSLPGTPGTTTLGQLWEPLPRWTTPLKNKNFPKTTHLLLSGTGKPSSVHLKCGGGLPDAVHLRDNGGPGCKVWPLNLLKSSGLASEKKMQTWQYSPNHSEESGEADSNWERSAELSKRRAIKSKRLFQNHKMLCWGWSTDLTSYLLHWPGKDSLPPICSSATACATSHSLVTKHWYIPWSSFCT